MQQISNKKWEREKATTNLSKPITNNCIARSWKINHRIQRIPTYLFAIGWISKLVPLASNIYKNKYWSIITFILALFCRCGNGSGFRFGGCVPRMRMREYWVRLPFASSVAVLARGQPTNAMSMMLRKPEMYVHADCTLLLSVGRYRGFCFVFYDQTIINSRNKCVRKKTVSQSITYNIRNISTAVQLPHMTLTRYNVCECSECDRESHCANIAHQACLYIYTQTTTARNAIK